MKKETIETLIKLTQNEIDEFNFDLDMSTVNLNRLKEVANKQAITRYEKSIIKLKSGLSKLNSCLSDLQKLKEFKLPTDEEIEKQSWSIGASSIGERRFVDGADWVIEQIKSKLS